MASATVRSKAVVLLLFIRCLLLPHCFSGFSVRSLFCFAVVCTVFSSFAIISLGMRELVALLLLYSECHVAVIVLLLFLMVPWVRL